MSEAGQLLGMAFFAGLVLAVIVILLRDALGL